MNFSRFLDIQSCWEVPSIAYFCSLFRTAFNLLDFDIEELEEALLTDGTEETASSLLTELIVRLLNGCLGNNDISAFNYQMYLRRLFRRKCQETGRYNPFNTDIDFQFLPIRTKVEILYALCDFRLDADDVYDLFKNLEAESLRVEPLGYDDNDSAYWYFYGTRLYREDVIRKSKGKNKKKKGKESKKRGLFYGDAWLDDDETERIWQVVCFTEEDWIHLTDKFSKATSKIEKELYRSLSQNFLPEIPRLFQEKERLQRKRLLELAPRRTSNRVLQKIKQKEEETKQVLSDVKEEDDESKQTESIQAARESRAKRRNLLRTQSASSDCSESSTSGKEEMPQKVSKRSKSQEKRSKNSSATHKGEPPPEVPIKTGRKTNNSLASVTGQILIPDNDEPSVNSTRKKLKTSQIFSQTEEDIQTDMYKVLEQLTAHEDAWPFLDPVEEKYAPNYYTVIRRPMDLKKMEERLDSGYYTDFSMFKADFKLIVNNCRLYNGHDNEYTLMVDNLQSAFDRLTEKYIHRLSSSDEEIAVEFQLPTPSRKHKLKLSESPTRHKRKKRKSHSDNGEPKSGSSDIVNEDRLKDSHDNDKKVKESHKNKESKDKKKRKGHRHGKHSKNHKKESKHKSENDESLKSKHSKKQKHSKEKSGKKVKIKKKKTKYFEESTEIVKHSSSIESVESSNRSRSASPLPSIHTLTPSPTELDHPELLSDPDFFKDKYDKIKERRRHAAKDAWESLFDYKQKSLDKQKQNLNIPIKDKNQQLRETIEKLKAKSEKYKDNFGINNFFSESNLDKNRGTTKNRESSIIDRGDFDFSEDDSSMTQKGKNDNKKGTKKSTAKNESASEALEQAVKDISKWLDDAPKSSAVSSPCDSPAQTISTEEHDNSRLDDEFPLSDKNCLIKKEISRKRTSSREPKLFKRREVQRTIDRLQPGKSKGNLLVNKTAEKVEEVTPQGPLTKTREVIKSDGASPKLSLGSVLPTVEFTLGNDHNFSESEAKTVEEKSDAPKPLTMKTDQTTDVGVESTPNSPVKGNKKDAEVETEPSLPPPKPNQEKATPNLSAWFKAFGAPKSTSSTPAATKKKVEETDIEEKSAVDNDNKIASPKTTTKCDSLTDPETPNPEGGDSPLPNVAATPRQRRTSTGSSVSERSSFSQDLDSPRHQMSHNSPLLRSPASPRTDDFQKITYPIINGTVRAGFYQDTTSIKSSPEKSCSPREGPQSPYSPYSQHVYASNSGMGSTTPNYFADHNKSPVPTYSQNPPPFYDSSKAPVVSKPTRVHDDYTLLGPDSYPPSLQPISPLGSGYQQNPITYSQPQESPDAPEIAASNATTQILPDPKSALFPVKKRSYTETELSTLTFKKAPESKEIAEVSKNEYPKATPSKLPTSVDDIAAALSEKSEMAKLNALKDKAALEYSDKHAAQNRTSNKIYENENINERKHLKDPDPIKPAGISTKDNVDMVNMGYENDRRNSDENTDLDFGNNRETSRSNVNSQQKVFETESLAINLGMSNVQIQKNLPKTNNTNIPPAHSQERPQNEINLNQGVPHAHHNQYDSISSQSISNFSLSDIELANKKLFACNVTSSSTAIDYGNWKMSSQTRKQDMIPSDYSSTYNPNNMEKLKSEMNAGSTSAMNFNKSLQQQYSNYNAARSSIQRTQELQQNLPSELRIPNPRGMMKNDHMTIASSISENEMIAKTIDSLAKNQKTDKLVQNHPLVNSPYNTPYSSHSSLPLDSLRNLPNMSQMLERAYSNNERYLSSFASSTSSLYDKTFQMAQMYKSMPSEVHPATTSFGTYSQPSTTITKLSPSVSNTQTDKTKNKRKRTEPKPPQPSATQSYLSSPSCNADALATSKPNMVPGSAFNFGASSNMSLGGGLYGDNGSFTTNHLMAANYMAAAVAHQQQQQRNSVDTSTDKMAKPAHQNSSHSTNSFPFIGHSQVRAGYPFADSSSPLYQQYLQRHQEEILRQTGAQIMGLYQPTYPTGLGGRQPYDSINSINRPSWL